MRAGSSQAVSRKRSRQRNAQSEQPLDREQLAKFSLIEISSQQFQDAPLFERLIAPGKNAQLGAINLITYISADKPDANLLVIEDQTHRRRNNLQSAHYQKHASALGHKSMELAFSESSQLPQRIINNPYYSKQMATNKNWRKTSHHEISGNEVCVVKRERVLNLRLLLFLGSFLVVGQSQPHRQMQASKFKPSRNILAYIRKKHYPSCWEGNSKWLNQQSQAEGGDSGLKDATTLVAKPIDSLRNQFKAIQALVHDSRKASPERRNTPSTVRPKNSQTHNRHKVLSFLQGSPEDTEACIFGGPKTQSNSPNIKSQESKRGITDRHQRVSSQRKGSILTPNSKPIQKITNQVQYSRSEGKPNETEMLIKILAGKVASELPTRTHQMNQEQRKQLVKNSFKSPYNFQRNGRDPAMTTNNCNRFEAELNPGGVSYICEDSLNSGRIAYSQAEEPISARNIMKGSRETEPFNVGVNQFPASPQRSQRAKNKLNGHQNTSHNKTAYIPPRKAA